MIISRKRAVYELILAAALWGFCFIAVKWALQSFSSFAILFLRFAITGVIGILFAKYGLKDAEAFNWRINVKASWRTALALCLLLWFQTVGLEYTTAVNSSFITTLYVIHVPLLYGLFYRKFHFEFLIYSAFALLGVLFLISPDNGQWNPFASLSLDFNKGDILTFVCSLCAAFHILFVEADIKKSSGPFHFNNFQFLISTIFLLPFFLLEKQALVHSEINFLAVLGMAIIILGGSLIAFFLQVRSQTVIDSKVASFLFLLEAPFATFFALMLLGESLTWNQIVGTLIIFFSCFLVLRK